MCHRQLAFPQALGQFWLVRVDAVWAASPLKKWKKQGEKYRSA
jgi:hypothetical protein